MEGVFYKNLFEEKPSRDSGFEGDVIRKKVIGHGSYAEVFEVEVKNGSHIKNFALKDYSRHGDSGVKYAKSAFENYLSAKDAKLRVFPTVRINADGNQLLMTLGSNEEYLLVAKDSRIDWERVEEITNFDDLITRMENDYLAATRGKIDLGWDSIFYIIKKTDPTNVDFVIGDYDLVITEDKENPLTYSYLFKNNIFNIRIALEELISHYVKGEKKREYEKLIYGRIDKLADDYKKEFENKDKEFGLGKYKNDLKE